MREDSFLNHSAVVNSRQHDTKRTWHRLTFEPSKVLYLFYLSLYVDLQSLERRPRGTEHKKTWYGANPDARKQPRIYDSPLVTCITISAAETAACASSS
jgi:hypothetical protein